MPRYKLTLEYDGTPYMGWQRQKHGPSVQQTLEDAIARVDEAPVTVFGAGRTDAGVHALAQVAHVDTVKDLRFDKLRDATNFHLGDAPIAVVGVERVTEAFHARFSAEYRTYRYRVIGRRPPLALDHDRVWRVPQALDPEPMHAAAQALVGTHDFTTFRDLQCQAKSPLKTLSEIAVFPSGAEIHVEVGSRSFLHKQVRSIVGSLVEVGRGKRDVGFIADILEARDREACGPVAPPWGLYLTGVRYPM